MPIMVLLVATMTAAPVAAARPEANFITDQDAMLWNLAGGSVEPILTVGDEMGSYMFDAIPDGISVASWGSNSVKVFVNHETSTVPFPYSTSSPGGNLNDFTDSLVSKLRINRSTHKVTAASLILDDGDDVHRLCSNFLATSIHGFDRPILLTNEEGIDWVNRAGLQWPATEGADTARQIGAVVARDLGTGVNRIIWGMGRHNHENSLPLKGYGYPVVLSGDDSFVTSPNQSQVYSYIADSRADLWNDEGELWAFVSDDLAYDDYYDFVPGSTHSVTGHFIQVPKEIATGRNPDGSDMMAADVPAEFGGPYDPPPSDGAWQRPPGATSGPGVDGPQWVLETWSDEHNVFSFVRVEDMAYDKRQGMRNVVYIVDSGRGRGPSDSAGLDSDGNAVVNKSTNGRIWKMVFDKNDPTVVTSLSILIEGDDSPTKTLTEIRQPDNIETTKKGIYITEDPGSSQQFAPGDLAGKNARVWQYKFGAVPTLNPVLEVNQDADEGDTDVDSSSEGSMGAWEASGIIDVSQWFGPGMFLITVQAHTLFIETAPGPDINDPPTGIDWTYKREGGQLLLVKIPGG
ncbi:MAG TPA: hypothetical protein VIF08_01170 [Candidatus Limnocylindrales bacterium]